MVIEYLSNLPRVGNSDVSLTPPAATGYHGVELLMDYKQQHGFEWDTPRAAWDGLKAQVDASDVVISSLTSCQNFHSENAADREENRPTRYTRD